MSNKLIILLSTLLIAGAVFFFIFHKSNPDDNILAIDGIPQNTAILFKANGLMPLLNAFNDNNILRNSSDSSGMSLMRIRTILDSLCSENALLSDVLNDSTTYFAIIDNNKGNNSFLFLLPLPSKQSTSEMLDVLSPFFTNIGLELNEYSASNEKANSLSWYLHFSKGLLLISNNKQNIKESLLVRSSKQTLRSDTSFQKVFRASGSNVPATLFLNYKHLGSCLESLVNPSHIEQFKKLIYSNGWAALDLNVADNSIVVQGFSSSSTTNFIGSRLLRMEQPVESDFYNYIPNNVFSVSSFYLSDAYNFRMLQTEYLKKNKTYEKTIKSIRQDTDNEVDSKLSELLGKAVGTFTTFEKGDYNRIFLMNCTSNFGAYEFLAKFDNKKKSKRQNSDSDSVINLSIIVKLPVDNIPYILTGDYLENQSYSYACNLNDYIIFGPSESYLKKYIELIRSRKTILTDSLFIKTATEFLLTRTNINQIIFPRQAYSYFLDVFKPEIAEELKSFFRGSENVVGLQVSASNDLNYLNGFIYSGAKSSSENALEWGLKLDTGVVYMNKISFNNKDASACFLIQDSAFNVYLLSHTGRVIWRRPLDGKILGKVQSIDFYKNNKIQMLFNTSNSLYLIDREGKNVKNYPIKFKNAASSGISVADFDGNKNYRFYIALRNKSFVVLTKEGKKVDGWKFRESKEIVNNQPKCFTFNKKDYILFHDSLNIYLLNRKGEQKLSLREKFSRIATNDVYIEFQKQYFRLITSDANANICIIYPDGRIITKPSSVASSKFSTSFLSNSEMPESEITFLDSNSTYTYNLSGNLLNKGVYYGGILGVESFFYEKNKTIVSCISSNGTIQTYNRDSNRKMAKAMTISGDYPFIFLPLVDNKSNQYILCSKGDSVLYYKIH